MNSKLSVNIACSNHFLEEKKYVFDIIFKNLLECDYDLIIHEENSYVISIDGHKIVFSDVFFSKLKSGEKYFDNIGYIPKDVKSLRVEELFANEFTILFGEDSYLIGKDFIEFEFDLFASAFFMLTRWEEITIKERDNYDRFPEEKSLAIKFGFNNRPIVNEYAELLADIFAQYGIRLKRQKEYRLFLTHDIDDFARYDRYGKYIKALAGDILKRRSLKAYFTTISDYINIKFNKSKDVYDTFDFLMDESDKIGVKSSFYFIPGKNGETDVRFDIDNPKVIETINNIIKRDHIVGIHPGFDTLGSQEQLIKEYNRLKQHYENIEEGRQHYLRIRIPDSWNEWHNAGLRIDSSLGYYSTIGFRSGICNEYELFDVVNSKKIGLVERPLIVMDTALRRLTSNKDKAIKIVLPIVDQVRKYRGDFVLLWHNSNLTRNEWYGWNIFYKNLLKEIK